MIYISGLISFRSGWRIRLQRRIQPGQRNIVDGWNRSIEAGGAVPASLFSQPTGQPDCRCTLDVCYRTWTVGPTLTNRETRPGHLIEQAEG